MTFIGLGGLDMAYDLGDFTEIGDEGLIVISVSSGWGDEAWGDERWGGEDESVIVTGGDTEWTDIDEP